MDTNRIVHKAAKEIEKRVSAVSNLQKDIQGVKSDLLDILFLEGSKDERKEYGNIIKAELKKKIEIAKKRTPPRMKYIENMERIIKDLDRRISGKKTDDNRKQLLDLDKKRGFNSEVLKEIADTTIASVAEKNDKQEQILKRLAKKKDYKEELARLLEHRSDEVKDDTQKKNIKQLTEKIRNVQEMEKTTKKRTTKIQNMITKVRLLTALGLTTRGGIEFFKEMKKHELTQTDAIKVHKEKKELSKKHVISLERLQTSIKKELIEEGITYEEIVNAVNGTTNEETRKQIIALLYAGDIIGLQEFLCMKENSEYALNKATGYIDRNTMNILEGGRFGMTGKEIMENDTITQDVKDAYMEFMTGIQDNNDNNYLIDSKIYMHSFLFDTQHRLIDVQPIIVGKDIGKDQEYVPFRRFYEKGVRIYYKDVNPKELNRNTPEGLFAIEGIDKLEEDQYMIQGPKRALILDPIKLTTPGLTYDKKKIKMRQHPVFLAEDDSMRYITALKTPTIEDNNQSKGCVNNLNFGRIFDNIKADPNGSRVYITQYNKYKNMEKKKELYANNQKNNKKNYFPQIRRK